MKRCTILALALVLGCTIFTGCRRGTGDTMTVPPTTQAATERPPAHATEPTRPIATAPATEDPATDAPTEDTTQATEGMTEGGQSRSGGMAPAGR